MSKYTHIFFDLDHTLWDYDVNATEALTDLYHEFGLGQLFTTPSAFIGVFHHVNHHLWDRYNKGEIDREYIRKHRFARVVSGRMEPDEKLTTEMSDYFISTCPTKPTLIPGAMEILEKLVGHFKLGIITNGFNDTQATKLQSSRLNHFFEFVITSESTSSRKPDRGIFDHAAKLSAARPHEVVMIGDNLNTDIAGATAAGWDAIWFHPPLDKEATDIPHRPAISHLSEIWDLVS